MSCHVGSSSVTTTVAVFVFVFVGRGRRRRGRRCCVRRLVAAVIVVVVALVVVVVVVAVAVVVVVVSISIVGDVRVEVSDILPVHDAFVGRTKSAGTTVLRRGPARHANVSIKVNVQILLAHAHLGHSSSSSLNIHHIAAGILVCSNGAVHMGIVPSHALAVSEICSSSGLQEPDGLDRNPACGKVVVRHVGSWK